MKRILVPLLLAFTVFLTGCLDILQEITINNDGSGMMATKMDMGQMMAMVMSMSGEESKTPEKMDTSFSIKSYIDTVSSLSAEEKKLLQGLIVNLNMDMDNQVFVLGLQVPFSKPEEVNRINELIKKNDLMSKAFEKMDNMEGGKKQEESKEEDMLNAMGGGEGKSPMLQSPDEFLVYDFKKGKLVRALDTAKLNKLQESETLQKMKEAMDSGMPPIKFTYAINLPKPAKKIEGKNAVLSDDKRKVTVVNTLDELFDDPSKFEFSIEY